MNKLIPEDLINKMMKDKVVRTSITKDSFLHFFHFYYAHYIKYETANFQKEIMHLLESSGTESLCIVAFRGSAKSTMITTAYPIWSILGKQQKKFCMIFCQTKDQAKQHMMNIRTELEGNELLKRDLGPFQEESDEWGSHSIVFKKHGARITVSSSDQSIRGLRHNEHRPDLLICDDVENIQSTKTRESRNKKYDWLRGEVVPAGDKNTRLIIVGNLLHEDSLLMRIKEEILQGKTKGVFKEYPLIDFKGNCLWVGKYPTDKEIQEEKMKVASEISWQREYLLKIIPDEDQVIYSEWIVKYKNNKLPPINHKTFRGTYSGVDLAISQKDTADFTAMVSAHVHGRNEKLRVFILPELVNMRLNFPQQVELLKTYTNTTLDRERGRLFVESIAYQDALPQMLESQGIKVEGIKPHNDKRTRLALTASLIKNGVILFPETGCEKLIEQIVGFGVEKHDDLADAFSMLVLKIIELHSRESTIIMGWLGFNDEDDHFIGYSDYYDVLKDVDCLVKKEEN